VSLLARQRSLHLFFLEVKKLEHDLKQSSAKKFVVGCQVLVNYISTVLYADLVVSIFKFLLLIQHFFTHLKYLGFWLSQVFSESLNFIR
jgi:hypothetical protein